MSKPKISKMTCYETIILHILKVVRGQIRRNRKRGGFNLFSRRKQLVLAMCHNILQYSRHKAKAESLTKETVA
jgi:hypothetical protein